MKKVLFLLVFIVGALHATDTLIEAKGAYYYPASSDFREIYSSGGMFGAEASFRTWGQLYTWGSGSFMIKKGHSIGLHDTTRIAFYPFGAGIKYLFPVKFVEFYLGAGALGAYMHIHDHGTGVVHKICRWGGGGIVKAGVILNRFKYVFLDVFTDYSFLYVPVSTHRDLFTQTANLSGWSIGLGIGYRFGADCYKPSDFNQCCKE